MCQERDGAADLENERGRSDLWGLAGFRQLLIGVSRFPFSVVFYLSSVVLLGWQAGGPSGWRSATRDALHVRTNERTNA